MKKTINFYEFTDEFDKMGRKDSFSYEGKKALFNYLKQLEEDLGEEFELDIIALCCEYSEYQNIEEFNNEYGYEYEDSEEIKNHTQVIDIDKEGFIIQNF